MDESMKATKTLKKWRYQKDAEKNAGKKRVYSYERDAARPRRKKYSYERDLERATRKGLSKAGLGWFLAILFLIVGAVGGFFAIKYAFKDDAFAMNTYANGEVDITIGVDGDALVYTEQGASCVSFGKDYSDDVIITYYYRADATKTQEKVDKVDETKAGMYYAVYTTKSARYKSVTLIRNIYVTEVED